MKIDIVAIILGPKGNLSTVTQHVIYVASINQ